MNGLEVTDLHVTLEGARIIQGVTIHVPHRRAIALLGHNGAGKTTLVRSIMGLAGDIEAGSIHWDGTEITQAQPWDRAKYGLCYVPQARRLFPSLTVDEHLDIASRPPRTGMRAWTREDIFHVFPNLERRRKQRGGLSGGEQQMLAIARALIANPRTIILDEPTEGLAPAIVARLAEVLEQLKADGIGIFLVEQDFRMAARIADTVYIQQAGRIVYQASGLDEAAIAHAIEESLIAKAENA